MDQLPRKDNDTPHIDDTQEITPIDEMFQNTENDTPVVAGEVAPENEGVEFTADANAEPISESDHSKRNKILLGAGAVVTAAALFFAGKAFGSGGEGTPAASPTAVDQKTPRPTATTPDTPATTEQTPAPSNTSPTNIPSVTETKTVVVPPVTNSETAPTPSEATPSASETTKTPEDLFIKSPAKAPYIGLNLDAKKQKNFVDSMMISADKYQTPEEALVVYYQTLATWLATGTDVKVDTMLNTTDEMESHGSPIWAKLVDAEYSKLYIEALTGKDPNKLTADDISFSPDKIREGYRLALERNADNRYRTQDQHPNGYAIKYGYLLHPGSVEKRMDGSYMFEFKVAGVEFNEGNELPDEVRRSIAKSDTIDQTLALKVDTVDGKKYWFVTK